MQELKVTHPLDDTIGRIRQMNEYIKLQHGVPTDAGWVAPAELLASTSPQLTEMITVTQKRLHTTAANMIGGRCCRAINGR